ncbi:MAG: glycoside hydrolase family protein [Beutenbergiaceae bacterium]
MSKLSPAMYRLGIATAPSPDFAAAIGPIDRSRALLQLEDWYVWGGSPIAAADGYYLFYSRWPRGTAGRDVEADGAAFDDFGGWMKHSEIAVAYADHPHGQYRHVGTVMRGSQDLARWDTYNATNPHVRCFEGKYYLYYIATNPGNSPEPWRSRQPTHRLRHHGGQRVGVVVADTLADLVAGRGVRSPWPLVEPDYRTTFQMTVNPSVTQMPSGEYLMAYKAWGADGGYITVMATSARPDGPFTVRGTALDGELQAEDPYLWFDASTARYYAIVKDFYPAQDRARALTAQFGALALVESDDGLDWRPAQHPLVSLRELRTIDGTVIALTRLERPQLLFDDGGVPIALNAAMSVGDPESDPTAITVNVAIPLNW